MFSLQVNELDEEPQLEDEKHQADQGDVTDMSRDVDDANLHILQELGEAGS